MCGPFFLTHMFARAARTPAISSCVSVSRKSFKSRSCKHGVCQLDERRRERVKAECHEGRFVALVEQARLAAIARAHRCCPLECGELQKAASLGCITYRRGFLKDLFEQGRLDDLARLAQLVVAALQCAHCRRFVEAFLTLQVVAITKRATHNAVPWWSRNVSMACPTSTLDKQQSMQSLAAWSAC